MATISLGMIVRNEGRTLKACLESVAPYVDHIFIGLAGESTDNTLELIKSWNTEHPIEGFIDFFDIEWEDDFAKARQAVFDRCLGDYFLWLDGDDVLVGGENLRGYIEKFPDADAFYLGYDYARDDDGLNTCFLIRERLVKRHRELPVDWKWIGRIHEVLAAQFPVNAVRPTDAIVRHHKPADKHEPDRNLKILYQQLEESEPNPDPRVLAYLGSENAGRGNLSEAIVHWQRFIKLSGWDEEKYQAQVKISNAYRALGQIKKAITAAVDAVAILPEWPDAYFAMAKAYASEPLENFKAAIEWIKVGASKPKPDTMLIVNPLEYTYEPSLLLAVCYSRMGDWEMALGNYQQAYSLRQDPVVAEQITYLTREVEGQHLVQGILKLREFLGRHDEWLKVHNLFEIVPRHLRDDPRILAAWDRTMKQTGHIYDPEIMVNFYRENPHWTSIPEETITEASWLEYPRMKFALDVVQRINAKTIYDWGCSDGFIALPLVRELEDTHVIGFDLDPRCVELANERAKRWDVPALFLVGDVTTEKREEVRDLAIFFEVLEHVVEPEETLARLESTAKHIAITTPYLAWEKGNLPEWDKIEPKGHLRIFDLKDIEVLLTGRGKIHNLYRQEWGNSGWIFADYEVGAQYDKNIIIFAPPAIEPWGPRKLAESGLGGSETAAIKLAESFADQGHRTFVYNQPDSPGYHNGVCYRNTEEFVPHRTDLFISWRTPEAADINIDARRRVLWMHDTDAGDRLTEQRANWFHSIVVLTQWHKQFMLERYPFLNADQLVVIGNGIDFSLFDEPVVRDPRKVVYSSSPDRGLDVILEGIWPKVLEQVPDAELHVYYGWDNYDKFAAIYPELQPFRQRLSELFLNSKNVVQHGRIPQARLVREMQEAKIWLYPTYFTETYCITAVEAQLAGAIPITNHLAALRETVRSGIILEGDVRDSNVQQKYIDSVVHVLKYDGDQDLHERVKREAPAHSWTDIASLWSNYFLEAPDGGNSNSPQNGHIENLDDRRSAKAVPTAIRMPDLSPDSHLQDVPRERGLDGVRDRESGGMGEDPELAGPRVRDDQLSGEAATSDDRRWVRG